MMKRILGLLFCMMLVAVNCMAMTFSEPRGMGGWYEDPEGGIVFQNESSNKGDIYTGHKRDKRTISYKKGIASFGNANDAVYIHYGEGFHFGGPNLENTVPVPLPEVGSGIYFLGNNQDERFYLLGLYGYVGYTTHHIVVGKKNDGTFIKYFDTREIAKKYLGEKFFSGMKGGYLSQHCYCRGDSIIIEYTDPRTTKGHRSPAGAFRFKWDDATQWFGVEQVVY